jgi:cyclin L
VQSYHEKKIWLTTYERKMLRAFGFIMHVDHPHKFLISLINQVAGQDLDLIQESWNLVNDR